MRENFVECPQAGLDVSKHGGSAYNYDMGIGGWVSGSYTDASNNRVQPLDVKAE